MEITFKMDGIDKLRNDLEVLATEAELRKTNRQIFQRSADITEPRMKSHMPRSADNSKSGRRGYRPSGHAADNIPKKVSAKKAQIGWNLNGDAENWFYMKFVEWGTSKMVARDFITNTYHESESQYTTIAEEEYTKLLNEKLGG